MAISKIASANEIVDSLLQDIADKISTNSYGEQESDYYSFAEDENGNRISVKIIEERDGLVPEEYFYTVHFIDDITEKDCEIFSTNEQTRDSLFELISSLIDNMIKEESIL